MISYQRVFGVRCRAWEKKPCKDIAVTILCGNLVSKKVNEQTDRRISYLERDAKPLACSWGHGRRDGDEPSPCPRARGARLGPLSPLRAQGANLTACLQTWYQMQTQMQAEGRKWGEKC